MGRRKCKRMGEEEEKLQKGGVDKDRRNGDEERGFKYGDERVVEGEGVIFKEHHPLVHTQRDTSPPFPLSVGRVY